MRLFECESIIKKSRAFSWSFLIFTLPRKFKHGKVIFESIKSIKKARAFPMDCAECWRSTFYDCQWWNYIFPVMKLYLLVRWEKTNFITEWNGVTDEMDEMIERIFMYVVVWNDYETTHLRKEHFFRMKYMYNVWNPAVNEIASMKILLLLHHFTLPLSYGEERRGQGMGNPAREI